MDKTNTAVIARRSRPKDGVASARLCRATQYSRDASHTPRSRGVLDRPVKPGDDSLVVAGVLPSRNFFLGALATKQSIAAKEESWIASRSLPSGAHSRDPVARNDERNRTIKVSGGKHA
jgi:hypothetical protein